jgi:hypothetical protein
MTTLEDLGRKILASGKLCLLPGMFVYRDPMGAPDDGGDALRLTDYDCVPQSWHNHCYLDLSDEITRHLLRLAIAKGHQGAQVVTQITRNSLMDGSVSVYLRVLDVWGGRMFNLVTQTRRQAWPELDAYVQAIELLPSRFDEVTP